MSRPYPPIRRILLPVVLALTLVAESIAVVAAVDLRTLRAASTPSGIEFASQATRPTVRLAVPGAATIEAARPSVSAVPWRHDPRLRTTPPEAPADQARAVVPVPVRPSTAAINKAESIPKSSPATASGGTGAKSGSTSYSGSNRMWFPSLGINGSVRFFACTSTAYPGNSIYRWGCGGANNVYLFGHAHSVFKPLHDAYVRGTLRKGMKVVYADGNGKVRTYKIAWWKVTTPDNGAFAYAAQSKPSMTLQTCVGAQSQYRLIVRLLAT